MALFYISPHATMLHMAPLNVQNRVDIADGGRLEGHQRHGPHEPPLMIMFAKL